MGFLLLAHPGAPGKSYTFQGSDTRIVVGGGRLAGDTGIIETFSNNTAIISSGSVSLETSGLQLLRLRTEGSGHGRVSFFWRNGPEPEDLHSTEVTGNGVRWVNLGDHAQWSGRVTELGVIFYAGGAQPPEFHFIELTPASPTRQLRKLAHDWRQMSLWSLRSSNWIAAGASDSLLPLPVLMAGWVLSTVLLSVILLFRGQWSYSAVMVCALLAWTLLDVRWTANRLVQASQTLHEYPIVSATYLRFGDDQIGEKLVSEAFPIINDLDKRTVVTGDKGNMRFQLQRAKYHALPARVYFHDGPVGDLPLHIADYVLVLRQQYRQPGPGPAAARALAADISRKSGLEAKPLWETPEGILISIKDNHPPKEGSIR
jgi:hypothetical protein